MATDTHDAIVQVGSVPPQPHLLGLDAEGWVYVGLTIFLLLAIVVLKAPKLIGQALDKKIADTRKSLDDAVRLRTEAEALLADAKAQQAAAHKDAQAILAGAQSEAVALVEKARRDVDTLIERRQKMAEDKIAAAERTAVGDVRAATARAAAGAAATLIAARHDTAADGALIDRTIASLG
jgi:F-type H+-transporting ATPase subunit b